MFIDSTSTLRSAGAPNNCRGRESINIWLLRSQSTVIFTIDLLTILFQQLG